MTRQADRKRRLRVDKDQAYSVAKNDNVIKRQKRRIILEDSLSDDEDVETMQVQLQQHLTTMREKQKRSCQSETRWIYERISYHSMRFSSTNLISLIVGRSTSDDDDG